MSARPCVGCGATGKGRICTVCVGKRASLRSIAALAARAQGWKYSAIGAAFGVKTERARQLVHRGDRRFFNVTIIRDGQHNFDEAMEYRIK